MSINESWNYSKISSNDSHFKNTDLVDKNYNELFKQDKPKEKLTEIVEEMKVDPDYEKK